MPPPTATSRQARGAARQPCRTPSAAASRCGRSASATRPTAPPCWTGSTCTCRPARPSPWSVRTGRAKPPWSSCSPACTSQLRARCCWTGWRSRTSTWPPGASGPRPPSRTSCVTSCWPRRRSGSATCRATIAEALPDGLATPLGRSFTRGQDLSGGQWQRLALARGMMRDVPLLLILDEPTASLDAITEAALFERYLAARKLASQAGAITLLVSHRFSTVRMADLIVVLDNGRIAASGDHASLIRAGGLYAELYEMQARSYR